MVELVHLSRWYVINVHPEVGVGLGQLIFVKQDRTSYSYTPRTPWSFLIPADPSISRSHLQRLAICPDLKTTLLPLLYAPFFAWVSLPNCYHLLFLLLFLVGENPLRHAWDDLEDLRVVLPTS